MQKCSLIRFRSFSVIPCRQTPVKIFCLNRPSASFREYFKRTCLSFFSEKKHLCDHGELKARQTVHIDCRLQKAAAAAAQLVPAVSHPVCESSSSCDPVQPGPAHLHPSSLRLSAFVYLSRCLLLTLEVIRDPRAAIPDC